MSEHPTKETPIGTAVWYFTRAGVVNSGEIGTVHPHSNYLYVDTGYEYEVDKCVTELYLSEIACVAALNQYAISRHKRASESYVRASKLLGKLGIEACGSRLPPTSPEYLAHHGKCDRCGRLSTRYSGNCYARIGFNLFCAGRIVSLKNTTKGDT